MRIRTIYTPSDTADVDVNFRNVYTLTDLAKLGKDLAAAGVGPQDALSFTVDTATGSLTVIQETIV